MRARLTLRGLAFALALFAVTAVIAYLGALLVATLGLLTTTMALCC